MSDPIADILRENDTGCADGYVGEPIDDYDEVAKQIRQLIGKELLEGNRLITIKDYMMLLVSIHEKCQLGEDNEKG